MTIKHLLMASMLVAMACGSSIKPDKENHHQPSSREDAGVDEPGEDHSPREIVIDASSTSDWAYLDLESASVVKPQAPQSSSDWDLSLRRFAIATNGGVSGAAGVEVAVVT